MLKLPLLALVLAAASCGRKEASDTVADHTPRTLGGEDAQPHTVSVDGDAVPFVALGEPVRYDGVMAARDDAFQFSVSRAFVLDGTKTLRLVDPTGGSSDCAGDALAGPNYMVLKLSDGAEPQIVRSTEGIESGSGAVPPTGLAGFPGELGAGTYVLTVDYAGFEKACAVKGGYTVAEG